MAFLLRSRLVTIAVGALVMGCTSNPDLGATSSEGGTEGGTDDGGTIDSGPPGPPCSRLTTPLCKEGDKCEGPPDCASKLCRDGTCKAPSPLDGLKDGDKTDIDCGGSSAPACADGKGCLVGQDCISSVCKGGICQVPTHTDGVKNGDETGVDCGGLTAPKCPTGQGCASDNDCNRVKCDLVQKKCLAPSHSDGIKNGDETGIDCGGPTAPNRCAPGQGCAATTDCANVLCNAVTLVCDPPSATDGLKNGTETDVDCGGGAPTNAPACAAGKGCLAAGDCTSTACNYAKKCAQARSCVNQFGGTTCGKGEVGQAAAVHEDCCTSVPLPDNSVRVDKYEITAGRMREFIAKVGNNVQAWVAANRAITPQIADAMVPYLPTGLKTPTQTITRCGADGSGCASTVGQFGVLDHLGNNVFMPDRPCPNCGQGCYIGAAAGGNGHPTYWWDDATQTNEFGSLHRVATKDQLDVKSLNCTPQLLFAAFCAWDGGRLPTEAELGGVAGAWGPTGMPFGTATEFRDTVTGAEAGRIGYPFLQDGTCPGQSCFTVPMFTAGAAGTIVYHPEAATQNSTNFNPFPGSPGVFSARYAFPIPVNGAGVHIPDTNDQAYAVAAPGRMRHDFRLVGPGADDGYYDVAANLIEATGTIAGTDNATHNSWPTSRWVGGSFEGHTPNNRGGYDLSVLTKYGKQGARCVRPM